MKKNRIWYTVTLVAIGIIGGYFLGRQCSVKGMHRISEKCKVAEESKCSAMQIEKALDEYSCNVNRGDATICSNVCCGSFEMCGLSTEFLFSSMANYAKWVWKKTSVFENLPIHNSAELYDADNKLDARIVRLDFERLQQYLCYLKHKATQQGKTVVNVDIAYIRYTDNDPNGMKSNIDFFVGGDMEGEQITFPVDRPGMESTVPGIHSIALVPFIENTTGNIEFWDDSSVVYSPGISDCTERASQNHGWVCPPPNCPEPEKAILDLADLRLQISASNPWN